MKEATTLKVPRELEEAIRLREDGQLEAANRRLVALATQYPDDARVNYHCAWSFDALGREAEAVLYYERALIADAPRLAEDERQGAMLGLGSTYRTLGQYKRARDVLAKGVQKFPNHRALQVFYAMTLYNLKEHAQAMEILLRQLAETSNDDTVNHYKRAIAFYADKLDTTW